MKRNNATIQQARRTGNSKKSSAYATKATSGKQMYGPGCCGHRFTATQVAAARERARNSDNARPYESSALLAYDIVR